MTNWTMHIAQWKQSGKSRKAYCMEHQVSYHNFLYHLRKSDKSKEDRSFIALPSVTPSRSMTIHLSNGIRIDIQACLDTQILQVLRDA